MLDNKRLFRWFMMLAVGLILGLGAAYSPAFADSPISGGGVVDGQAQTDFHIYLPAVQTSIQSGARFPGSGPYNVCATDSEGELACNVQDIEIPAIQAAGVGDDCKGNNNKWLYLYDRFDANIFGQGRKLKFNDTSYIQPLSSYNFANKTSSVWNTTNCVAWLFDADSAPPQLRVVVPGELVTLRDSGDNNDIDHIYIFP